MCPTMSCARTGATATFSPQECIQGRRVPSTRNVLPMSSCDLFLRWTYSRYGTL
ncbi:hypothetical protein J6590_061690, partial [Homalodisca vitripennis]